ncbi:MAG TPA: heavy-metal-associated domain-containing protein [bacterium]|nr:heavy-metal-associated domain-containing protein [bacterium]HMW33972.1 heavy-metal-associated domain-containing protein [bacterium]HMW34974.1 heavy-metal-associated domain-containing protein [bacterium]HMZ03730.1 heavy-metal-associated domain-containing protein [bacterium]HNB10441.1 heavy-metal-associated domain-containing protein [bacterium]
MRLTILTLAAILISSCGKEEKLDKAVVKVNSAICGECSGTITKAVMAVNGVKKVEVDTDTKIATISYVPGSVKIGDIESAIVKSGYDANDQKADPAAYEQLPDCCKKK